MKCVCCPRRCIKVCWPAGVEVRMPAWRGASGPSTSLWEASRIQPASTLTLAQRMSEVSLYSISSCPPPPPPPSPSPSFPPPPSVSFFLPIQLASMLPRFIAFLFPNKDLHSIIFVLHVFSFIFRFVLITVYYCCCFCCCCCYSFHAISHGCKGSSRNSSNSITQCISVSVVSFRVASANSLTFKFMTSGILRNGTGKGVSAGEDCWLRGKRSRARVAVMVVMMVMVVVVVWLEGKGRYEKWRGKDEGWRYRERK